MADEQVAEIPDTAPAAPEPEMVACQCRSTYHWRQDRGACPNPARWCQWCKDGGCVLARRADAARERRERRTRSSSSSSRRRHGSRSMRGSSRHRGRGPMHELPMPPTVPFPMLPPLLPLPVPMPWLPWPGAGDASSSSSSSPSSSSGGSSDGGRRGTQGMFPRPPRHPWM